MKEKKIKSGQEAINFFRECGEELHWSFTSVTSGKYPGGIAHWNEQGLLAEGIDNYLAKLGEVRDEKGAHVCSIAFMSRSAQTMVWAGEKPNLQRRGDCVVFSVEKNRDICYGVPTRVIHIPSGLAEDGWNESLYYDDAHFEQLLLEEEDE